MVDFKVGDLVRLKSGGPVMTVCEKTTSVKLKCMWFEMKYAATPFDAHFHIDSLEIVEEPDVDAIREKLGIGVAGAN
ncbi:MULTISPECIES: DUF2158 domain-containing protein [Aeromonas]|uniref:DUF2158 domain-containing protein n=1 Tax=Aeromonas TaxID=642 RepID=UPI0030155CDF